MKYTKEQFINILNETDIAAKEAIKGMYDGYPCGGAYLVVPGIGKDGFVSYFKKYSECEERKKFSLGNWHISKHYKKGYTIYGPLVGHYQNMYMDIAAEQARARILIKYGFKVQVESYID